MIINVSQYILILNYLKSKPVFAIHTCFPDIPGPLHLLYPQGRVPDIFKKQIDFMIEFFLYPLRQGAVRVGESFCPSNLHFLNP